MHLLFTVEITSISNTTIMIACVYFLLIVILDDFENRVPASRTKLGTENRESRGSNSMLKVP